MPVTGGKVMPKAVTKLREAREFALALPGAEEADHWGNPSFRVGGRIFATLPDSDHMNVMIDPFDVAAAGRVEPDACAELPWGKKLSRGRVDLAPASPPLVGQPLLGARPPNAPPRPFPTPQQ